MYEEESSWEEEDTQIQPESLSESVCSDSEESQSSPEISPQKVVTRRKLTVNVAFTQYEIIRDLAKDSFQWKITRRADSTAWDLLWTDTAVEPDALMKMKPFQKINHFPGMYMIARKNCLAKHLNKLKKLHPAEYNFFPRTWLLPAEFADLSANHSAKAVYIVKPEANSQGRGIYLTKHIDDLSSGDRVVVQEYIPRPLLIEGLKFDIRLYVLVAGCEPLRLFLHREGLVRLATQKYAAPTSSNLSKQYMHLTNYAINKNSKKFVYNTGGYSLGFGRVNLTSSQTALSEQISTPYDVARLSTPLELKTKQKSR